MYPASIRDYRHYLATEPTPLDATIVRAELDRVITENKIKISCK